MMNNTYELYKFCKTLALREPGTLCLYVQNFRTLVYFDKNIILCDNSLDCVQGIVRYFRRTIETITLD